MRKRSARKKSEERMNHKECGGKRTEDGDSDLTPPKRTHPPGQNFYGNRNGYREAITRFDIKEKRILSKVFLTISILILSEEERSGKV